MVTISSQYKFLYVDVGINGQNSDGDIWANCSLREALENKTINFPDPAPLPHCTKDMPFVCTGVDAFSLSKYTMKSKSLQS